MGVYLILGKKKSGAGQTRDGSTIQATNDITEQGPVYLSTVHSLAFAFVLILNIQVSIPFSGQEES